MLSIIFKKLVVKKKVGSKTKKVGSGKKIGSGKKVGIKYRFRAPYLSLEYYYCTLINFKGFRFFCPIAQFFFQWRFKIYRILFVYLILKVNLPILYIALFKKIY